MRQLKLGVGTARLAGDYAVRRGSHLPNGRGRLGEGPQLMGSVVKDSLRLSTHYGLMDPTHKSAAFVSPQSAGLQPQEPAEAFSLQSVSPGLHVFSKCPEEDSLR